MLFIVFTDKFDQNNIFEKLNADNFTEDNYDVILLTSSMQSMLLDGNAYQNMDINIAGVTLAIINDIEIDEKPWIKNLLKMALNSHKEICTLYHNNGAWTNQEEVLTEMMNNHIYSDLFDSRVTDSVYYEELSTIADAYAKRDISTYSFGFKALKKRFLKNEYDQLLNQLNHPDIINLIDTYNFNSFAEKNLISEDDWFKMSKEIKMLDQGNGKLCPKELNKVINKHVKIN
jgi:hypothetical protein